MVRKKTGQTDGRTPDRYITLNARRGQRKNTEISNISHSADIGADFFGAMDVNLFPENEISGLTHPEKLAPTVISINSLLFL